MNVGVGLFVFLGAWATVSGTCRSIPREETLVCTDSWDVVRARTVIVYKWNKKCKSADSIINLKLWGKELTCDKALGLCDLRADRVEVNGEYCGIAEQMTTIQQENNQTSTVVPLAGHHWAYPTVGALGGLCVVLLIIIIVILKRKKIFLFKPRTSPVPLRIENRNRLVFPPPSPPRSESSFVQIFP